MDFLKVVFKRIRDYINKSNENDKKKDVKLKYVKQSHNIAILDEVKDLIPINRNNTDCGDYDIDINDLTIYWKARSEELRKENEKVKNDTYQYLKTLSKEDLEYLLANF